MTRTLFALTASLALAASSGASAEDRPIGEIGYERGALGFDAIVAGDLSTAETQIAAARSVEQGDPARLINLGYIHMRTGRAATAQRLFEEARDAPRPALLVLANGEVADSRVVAIRALRRVAPVLANR